MYQKEVAAETQHTAPTITSTGSINMLSVAIKNHTASPKTIPTKAPLTAKEGKLKIL